VCCEQRPQASPRLRRCRRGSEIWVKPRKPSTLRRSSSRRAPFRQQRMILVEEHARLHAFGHRFVRGRPRRSPRFRATPSPGAEALRQHREVRGLRIAAEWP
jgi:hypothetical protein